MKRYNVKMPIVGFVELEVEAKDKKDALKEFWSRLDETDPDIEPGQPGGFDHVEWDYLEQIVRGNVFYGTLNAVDVEEIDDEDE